MAHGLLSRCITASACAVHVDFAMMCMYGKERTRVEGGRHFVPESAAYDGISFQQGMLEGGLQCGPGARLGSIE